MSNIKLTPSPCTCVPLASLVNHFSLNKRDRIAEAHDIDHKKIVIKGSHLFPIKIGSKWFYLDTDVDVSFPADLDSYQADQIVDSCDAAWTAKANVTATEEGTITKEGTASA